jgi:hypothetical protein
MNDNEIIQPSSSIFSDQIPRNSDVDDSETDDGSRYQDIDGKVF